MFVYHFDHNVLIEWTKFCYQVKVEEKNKEKETSIRIDQRRESKENKNH